MYLDTRDREIIQLKRFHKGLRLTGITVACVVVIALLIEMPYSRVTFYATLAMVGILGISSLVKLIVMIDRG